jgi:hypothetical protein
MARMHAEQCRAAAKAEGISPRGLNKAAKDMIEGGTLVDLMDNAMESANDAEIRRLVEKDD